MGALDKLLNTAYLLVFFRESLLGPTVHFKYTFLNLYFIEELYFYFKGTVIHS